MYNFLATEHHDIADVREFGFESEYNIDSSMRELSESLNPTADSPQKGRACRYGRVYVCPVSHVSCLHAVVHTDTICHVCSGERGFWRASDSRTKLCMHSKVGVLRIRVN